MASKSALAHTRRFNACHRIAAAINEIEKAAAEVDTGIIAARLRRAGAVYAYVDRCHEVQFCRCLGASSADLHGALQAWLRAARREQKTLEAKLLDGQP